MKKSLCFLALCLIQFMFSSIVLAQEFELTPRIQVHTSSNKSASYVKKQFREDKQGNEISSAIKIKTKTNTSQLNYSWGKHMTTSYSDRLYKTTIDASDNIIAVGSIGYSSSDIDGIIYKYDYLGNLLWSDQPAKSSDYDEIYGVVTDKIGNIYITGEFYSSAFNYIINSNGSSDIFIAKYNPDGILLWAKNAGGSGYDYGSNIALDDAGNVYVVGFFIGTAYWDGIYKTSSTQGDMFIAKYDTNGNVIWVRNGDVGENNYLYGIAVDKSGNAYVSANFSGNLQFEGAQVASSIGGTDMFLIKYDTSGNFKWIKTAGGVGNDGGNDTNIDSDGNILIAGYFRDNAQFENKTLTAHGTVDIFAAKYSPSGNLIWVKQFGGTGSQTAWTVCSDEKNNYYVTGWFSGTGAFDNTTIVSEGGSDAYIIKYDKNGILKWVEPTATGLDKQVGSSVFVKANNLAISGYYQGDMHIQGSSFPNSGGEDGYLALLTQSSDVQTSVYVNPNISLSVSQLKAGQSITFTGTQFSPVGKVDLYFSGTGTINPIIDYAIDVSGNFQFTLTTSTLQKIGEYVVTATDKISGKSISRTFQLIQDQSCIIDDFLKITEPNMSMIRLVGDPIILSWEDKVKFNVNPLFNYKHSYKVEYNNNNSSGAWQLIKDIQGTNPGYGNINISTSFTPVDAGIYTFRITDNYYLNRSVSTPGLEVSGSVDPDIKVEFKWDKFNSPANGTSLIGTAADGVARFYVVVSNINPLSSGIQSVKVTLSDPDNTASTSISTQYLGKVMRCGVQNNESYTEDANNANSIIAENSSPSNAGEYWFWYVAPDDFSRNEGDWEKGDRVITATFDITLLNGNPITKRKHIFIARPPLMLVHGLKGKPSTWDKFPKDDKGNLFIDDSRFKIKPAAVKMDPTSHFSVNSSQLLAGNDCNNSFISIISEMRKTGYACNQVDYVCHSMGGSILRYAVDSINKENKSVFFTWKNYGQGYVNKLITLDTPHNGSSFANLLCDLLTDDISGTTATIVSLLGIEDLYDFNFSKNTVSVAEAVADLRYKNGIKFNETKIHSHLIGCGTSCLDYKFRANLILWTLASMIPQFDSNDKCNSLDNYFTKNDYESDFMEANDLIVSLKSQFSSNNIDFLPDNCTKLTGIMHTSIFGSSPTEDSMVGKKVNLLLNTDVNSNLFGYIPSTKIASSQSPEKIVRQRFKFSNDKIKIIYPLPDATYNTGDTITLKLQVDTVGLKSFVLHFQDQFFFEVPASPVVEYRLIVSPEYTEKQSISALGNYFVSDTASISSASVDLMVKQVGSLLDFNVIPEVIIIEKGKNKLPVYEAIFPNAIAQLGQTDSISVIVKDPNIVSYDIPTNRFIGVEKGSTSALVSYRGKSKTVFFEIIQYEESPEDLNSGIADIKMDFKAQLNVKTYPNPFSESFTFEYSLPDTGITSLEIYNVYGIKVKSYYLGQQTKGSYNQNVDLKGLADGIYIYKLTSGKAIQNGSVVKL